MRVLHLDSGREMRGGQWQVLRLLEGLAEAGVESVLLARRESPLFRLAAEKGVRVEDWGLRPARRLAPQFDLIHAHDGHGHTAAALATLTAHTPVVVARRVDFAIGSRWKYGRPACYIAVSEHVKSVLMNGGVPRDRIFVIYDGVPLLEPSRGSDILAPANTGDPHKGAKLALEAAQHEGVRLRFSQNLERDLRDAGIFLYVTYAEGLGSGALLAMSAGVPVIASNVGGIPEVIRHRINGLLVTNTAPAIAEAIGKLRANPDYARELGQAARESV
ncbi:MAG TPA: glycosyltransferase family 4 protein, partial [Bryobacteraceae bacterium]